MRDDTAIILKWGTLKGWNLENESKKAISLMETYCQLGTAFGCMQQDDTAMQKQIILDLIKEVKGKIYLDWDGKYVSKEDAIKYVTEYGTE